MYTYYFFFVSYFQNVGYNNSLNEKFSVYLQ